VGGALPLHQKLSVNLAINRTDLVFAVSREFGFVGVADVLLFLCCSLLSVLGACVGRAADRSASWRWVLHTWLVVQSNLNIAVGERAMPTTGVALRWLAMGATLLLASCHGRVVIRCALASRIQTIAPDASVGESEGSLTCVH